MTVATVSSLEYHGIGPARRQSVIRRLTLVEQLTAAGCRRYKT